MNLHQLELTDADRQIWDEELESFVPRRLFDAHCHLVDIDHAPAETIKSYAPFFQNSSRLADLRRFSAILYPGRQVAYLALGTPIPGIDVAAHVQFHADEFRGQTDVVANRLVTPACKVEDIRRDIVEHGFVGLKPYRLFSVTGDPHQCRIHEFLTHEQLELANEMGLWVTMHLSRYDGCADEQNLADLREYTTRRYPRIRWILAHCARSFTYWAIGRAIEQLRDLPNLWYDVSAVTDVRPMATLFKRERIERILFGSDLIDATAFRGTYSAFGRAWYQVVTETMPQLRFAHCSGRPILCIYEQLLTMKHAAEWAGLSPGDIDAIFWKNAFDLFPQLAIPDALTSGNRA